MTVSNLSHVSYFYSSFWVTEGAGTSSVGLVLHCPLGISWGTLQAEGWNLSKSHSLAYLVIDAGRLRQLGAGAAGVPQASFCIASPHGLSSMVAIELQKHVSQESSKRGRVPFYGSPWGVAQHPSVTFRLLDRELDSTFSWEHYQRIWDMYKAITIGSLALTIYIFLSCISEIQLSTRCQSHG